MAGASEEPVEVSRSWTSVVLVRRDCVNHPHVRRLIHSADRRVTQTLASGTIIRQDFGTATRFVFFDTGLEEWLYATDGGTMFVVAYKGRPYGLTCRHVFKSFDWSQLVVTDLKDIGTKRAGLRSIAYPGAAVGEAVGSDVLDVAVIQFGEDVDLGFFHDSAYILDENTVVTSKEGDELHVAGALKTPSAILEDAIAPKFCRLELVDDTPSTTHDATLRSGFGMFDKPEFQDIVGLSGSPVFNVKRSALSGMVVRGMMSGDFCRLWYVDVFDILKLLSAVHEGQSSTYYLKTLTKIVHVPVAEQ
jgi:hypothetical protein